MRILFAPGAGMPSTSPWMVAWAARLGTFADVVTFDYAYAKAGRKAPDKLPKLLDAHREALRAAGRGTVLVGKSMGSRVGCHLALEEEVPAIVCLGYPLIAQGKTRAVRDEVLLQLKTRILFVQGSADPFGSVADFDRVRAKMQAPNELFVVDGGDHSLVLPKSRAGEQQASDAAVLAAIRGFLRA